MNIQSRAMYNRRHDVNEKTSCVYISFNKLRHVTKQLEFQKPRIFDTVSNSSLVFATRNKNIFVSLRGNFEHTSYLSKISIQCRTFASIRLLIKSPRIVRRCRDPLFTPCVSRRTTLVWPDLASTTRKRRTICGST